MPQVIRNWLGAVDGASISWKPEYRDGGKKKAVTVEKLELGVLAGLLMSAAMLLGSFPPLLLLLLPTAHAQEMLEQQQQNQQQQTVVESPGITVDQQRGNAIQGPRVVSSTPLTFVQEGTGAYLPFRIEVTYPTGQGLIQNVTNNSPQTVASISSTSGFPSAGLTTTTFVTNNTDTFNILLGQHYAQDVYQVATATVYANNGVVNRYEIPIAGSTFQALFKVTTTNPPRVLTPEEIQEPVTNRLDSQEARIIDIQGRMNDLAGSSATATNAVRLSVLAIAALVAISLVQLVAILHVRRKYERLTRPQRHSPAPPSLAVPAGSSGGDAASKRSDST